MGKPQFWPIAFRITLVGLGVWLLINSRPNHEATKIRYDQMLQQVQGNKVAKAVFSSNEQEITVITTDQQRLSATIGSQAPRLRETLERNKVALEFRTAQEEDGLVVFKILSTVLPVFLIFFVLSLFFRGASRGGGGAQSPFAFARSKAKLNESSSTFADVAGADEAKQELQEVVTFLKDATPFIRVGARIPRGVLLVGPPGTGKTLLARASSRTPLTRGTSHTT